MSASLTWGSSWSSTRRNSWDTSPVNYLPMGMPGVLDGPGERDWISGGCLASANDGARGGRRRTFLCTIVTRYRAKKLKLPWTHVLKNGFCPNIYRTSVRRIRRHSPYTKVATQGSEITRGKTVEGRYVLGGISSWALPNLVNEPLRLHVVRLKESWDPKGP